MKTKQFSKLTKSGQTFTEEDLEMVNKPMKSHVHLMSSDNCKLKQQQNTKKGQNPEHCQHHSW
jgi:ATP phosphoribosyltransferase